MIQTKNENYLSIYFGNIVQNILKYRMTWIRLKVIALDI